MRAHCERTEGERLLWRPFVGLICHLGAKELILVKESLAFFLFVTTFASRRIN